MNILQKDPADLRLHPIFKSIPKDQDLIDSIADDLPEIGILEPLMITPANQIVDGRHRWFAAKQKQLTKVPCRVVNERDAADIINRTLTKRRHYTPGQRAYCLALVIPEAFDEAQRRMLAGTKADPRNSVPRVKTLEQYAADIRVTDRYLRLAHELHRYFTDTTKRDITDEDGVTEHNVTFKEFYEPRLMREEGAYGLGAVKRGIAGILDSEKHPGKNKGGAKKNQAEQLNLFNKVIHDQVVRWDYWQKFDDTAKAEHWKAVREQAATLPADKCAALADYHSKLAAEFRKAAKQGAES